MELVFVNDLMARKGLWVKHNPLENYAVKGQFNVQVIGSKH